MNSTTFNLQEYKKLIELEVKANYSLYLNGNDESIIKRTKYVLDFYMLHGFELTKKHLQFEIERSKLKLKQLHELINLEQKIKIY
jgi:hypothetical protein